jgi:hypothetical protein
MSENDIILRVCHQIGRNVTCENVKQELLKISDRGRPTWVKKSPLDEAVYANRKGLIWLMVSELGLNIESVRAHSQTPPLYEAISKGNEYMVRFLILEMKAKVNISHHPWRSSSVSPLSHAVSRASENIHIVKLLIEEFGAEVNFKILKNTHGATPFLALHHAMCVDYR